MKNRIHQATVFSCWQVLSLISIMAGTFRQIVKATFLVSKKEGLSDEEFRKHYTEIHAPMALEVCQRHGGLDYSIVCFLSLSLFFRKKKKKSDPCRGRIRLTISSTSTQRLRKQPPVLPLERMPPLLAAMPSRRSSFQI